MLLLRRRMVALGRDGCSFSSMVSTKTFMIPILLLVLTTLHQSWARSICPPDNGGNKACDCAAKKDGVVLVCDRTKLHDVSKAMEFFRERQVVINYLTIRQSHVSRIPNGFFMGEQHNTTLYICKHINLNTKSYTVMYSI